MDAPRPNPAPPNAAYPPAPAHPAAPARPAGTPLRGLLVPAGVLGAVASAFAYVGLVDPNEPGHYPVCPLYGFTGLYCPGCGGLRSAHDFITGHFTAALHSNAMAVAGYLLFGVFWVLWAVRSARGLPLRIAPSDRQWWLIGSAVLVFSVVRNLPFGSVLAP
ncbi:DUF2752 domain-containing protein [Streptomyces xanthochromogenes]|uniref:DUF2752 domain-containing protein n=1 Tax=Streptomyces xanthochromogenes TaxID=67384 RepID=UPI0037ACEBE2